MTPPLRPALPPNPWIDLLIIMNKLVIKAFNASSKEAFYFIALNDTVNVIKYDRASLWSLEGELPIILGVSGQTNIKANGPLFNKWGSLVKEIKNLDQPIELKTEHFKDMETWEEIKGNHSIILWLPIVTENKVGLGLWLELGENFKDKNLSPEFLSLLRSTLLLGYGSAYTKFKSKWKNVSKPFIGKWLKYGFLVLIGLLFLIRVPLRVAAPCEIVPKDPTLVTAPLDGIIQEIVVTPGEAVNKDQLLAVYDKRAPLQNLKASQKQVEVIQSQVNRAETLGLSDPKSLAELAILSLKLEKEKITLDLAEYQARLLDIKAPDKGIVIMDTPEEWRGKPVKVGEKMMLIGSISHTKVRLWIPESDNIVFDFDNLIKIVLNIHPDQSYRAKLSYIANESTLHDNYIPSFSADADWVKPPEDIKLGLKGTAILYGEKVSLFYFLMRKPWLTLRNLLGY